jgi:hypothetical protein
VTMLLAVALLTEADAPVELAEVSVTVAEIV